MERTKQAEAVRLAQQGDREAVELLYSEWSERLLNFIRRQTGSSNAEDILSETFVSVMEHIGELKNPDAFGGWLYSVAYSRCMDFLKRQERDEHVPFEEDSGIAEHSLNSPLMLPEDYAVNESVKSSLRDIIGRLKPDQRSAVMMYYYEEKSVNEVAQAMGKTEPAVRKTLQRARDKIKERIERLCAGGAVFAAVPLEALLGTAFDDSTAKAAASGGARLAGGIGTKIAAGAAAAAIAVGVPLAVHYSGGGGYRPENGYVSGEKLSVQQLNEELERYTFSDTENFHFECEPPDPTIEKLYVIKTQQPQTFDDRLDTYQAAMSSALSELFGISPDPEKTVLYDGYYEYTSDDMYNSVFAEGSFGIYKEPEYSALLRESGDNTTDLDSYTTWKDTAAAKDTLVINGKNVSIRKAAENALKVINDHFGSFFNVGERLIFSDAIAVNGEDGKPNYFVIRFVHCIDGLTVNENGYIDYDPMSENSYISPSAVSVIMSDENTILSLRNSNYYDVKQRTEIEEAIGIAQAVEIVEEGLAPGVKYEVKDVELKYVTVGKAQELYAEKEMRPMWSFVLKYYPANSSVFLNTLAVYVDAIDGSLYYCDSSSWAFYKLGDDNNTV